MEKARIITHNWQQPPVKIHTFISPDDKYANSTHVIETEQGLVIIDAQFFTYYAQRFRQFIDSLNKPILYLIISHAHPDHYFGLSVAFSDIASYTTENIQRNIRASADKMLQELKTRLGDQIPDELMYPANILKPGRQVFDGLIYDIYALRRAEDEEQLVIKLPQLNVNILQDLVYNKVHLYLTPYIDHWIQILQRKMEYIHPQAVILAGHGLPGNKYLLVLTKNYLLRARSLLNQEGMTADNFKRQLIASYPDWAAPDIIDSYLPILFAYNP